MRIMPTALMGAACALTWGSCLTAAVNFGLQPFEEQTQPPSLSILSKEDAWVSCLKVAATHDARRKTMPVVSDAVEHLYSGDCAQAKAETRDAIEEHLVTSGGDPRNVSFQRKIESLLQQSQERVGSEAGRALFALRAEAAPPSSPSRFQSQSTAVAGSAPLLTCKGSTAKGLTAYNAGKYDEALCHWLPKARAGDAAAQNNLGVLFENGLTTLTPRSDEQAAEWYLLAARQSYALAMHNLARVQTRLGHADSAQSWLSLAAANQRQQVLNEQQALGVLSYSLGCAIGGGCSSGRGTTPLPPDDPPPRPPQCSVNPVFKDVYGNPKIDCR